MQVMQCDFDWSVNCCTVKLRVFNDMGYCQIVSATSVYEQMIECLMEANEIMMIQLQTLSSQESPMGNWLLVCRKCGPIYWITL